MFDTADCLSRRITESFLKAGSISYANVNDENPKDQ